MRKPVRLQIISMQRIDQTHRHSLKIWNVFEQFTKIKKIQSVSRVRIRYRQLIQFNLPDGFAYNEKHIVHHTRTLLARIDAVH